MLPSEKVIIGVGHKVHANPALVEYVFFGHGSHIELLFNLDPLGHVHDKRPIDPGGDVDPVLSSKFSPHIYKKL